MLCVNAPASTPQVPGQGSGNPCLPCQAPGAQCGTQGQAVGQSCWVVGGGGRPGPELNA